MTLRNAFEDLATEATLDDARDQLVAINNAGELVQALEALRMTVQSLSRSVGLATVDTTGRLRVLLDSISASLTLATITSVGTVTTVTGVTTVSTVTGVTTVSTLSNQTSMGGINANDQVPSLMRIAADGLRRNITVT